MKTHLVPVSARVSRRALLVISLLTVLALVLSTVSPALAGSSRANQATKSHLAQGDAEQAVKALAGESLFSTPLRHRRAAYNALLPFAVDTGGSQPENRVLPLFMLERMNADNADFFVDEARISSSLVIQHDWDLVQQLVKLLARKDQAPDAVQAYLDGLLWVLRADRHMAELALQDSRVVVAGAQAAPSLPVDQVNHAEARLNAAEQALANAMKALEAGDADRASHHFSLSWNASSEVMAVWNLQLTGDYDQDGLLDIVELRIGSSPFAADTDNDGLSDAFEFHKLIPYTLATSPDTDGNGLWDGDEDPDEDGLTNFAERDLGTDPLVQDTDHDTLSDGYEVNIFGSDPRLPDTDADGLRDDSEERLGTDPRNPDSDGDGIPDGEDSYFQTIGDADLGVRVDLVGVGDQSLVFTIQSLGTVAGLMDVPGLVGSFVDLSTTLPVSAGTVTMQYDPAQVPMNDYDNLRLVRYNSETAVLEELPNQVINTALNQIQADTSGFSPFGVVYQPDYDDTVNEPAVRTGFDEFVYGPNDDGSYPCTGMGAGTPGGCTPSKVPLDFTVNFFGATYTDIYLNNNGNITFDTPLSTYTPFDLTSTQRVIIAPFFGDVDTRQGNVTHFGYGLVDGHKAFGVTWPGVGCYSENIHVLNYFQLVLIEREDVAPGDFDIEFNYKTIQWETGEASGGDSNCLGGASARVGYSNGTGLPGTFLELPGSGIPGSFLDANPDTGLVNTSLNSAVLARYLFPVRAGAPVPGLDSDEDGLTDAQETSGMRTQFGHLVMTDPFDEDSDGDGLIDGSEVSGGPDIFTLTSDPTKPDTDGDDMNDFAELRGMEYRLNPFNPDYDGDGLRDGEEEYELGTDPTARDTDGDGIDDGAEVDEGLDPLLATPRVDALEVAREFAIGAICGEFCLDGHGNMAFFSGFLIVGAISAIPTPITIVVGLIADARDFLASLVKGDWGSLALNSLALLPWIGDAADVVGTVGKFAAKHSHLIGEIGVFLVRLDWLPEAARADGLAKALGEALVRSLGGKGLDSAKLQRLARAGVDLKLLDGALGNVMQDYPELYKYVDALKASDIDDTTGILRNSDLTVKFKKVVTGSRHATAHLIGAYTQWLAEAERLTDGWSILTKVSRINAPGYDLVLKRGDVVRLLEAKARSYLSVSDLQNYFFKSGTKVKFSRSYFLKQGLSGEALNAFEAGKLEIEVFINSPQSANIVQNLVNNLGGVLKAGYKNSVGVDCEATIIFTALNR